MATVSITVPDAVVARINDAFCTTFGFDPAGGLTKPQFTKAQIINYIKSVVRTYEANNASAAARTAAETQANTDISLS